MTRDNETFEAWLENKLKSKKYKAFEKYSSESCMYTGNSYAKEMFEYGAEASRSYHLELIKELIYVIREEYEDYYRWIDEGDIHVTTEYTDCIANLGKILAKAQRYIDEV